MEIRWLGSISLKVKTQTRAYWLGKPEKNNKNTKN